jgi:hypothetical protein
MAANAADPRIAKIHHDFASLYARAAASTKTVPSRLQFKPDAHEV